MKPMTVKQLKALLDRAPENASVWFDNWEYQEDGELELFSHPINFAEIKYSTDAFDIVESNVRLSCAEPEEWHEDEEQGAPIDPTTLTPEQLAVIS